MSPTNPAEQMPLPGGSFRLFITRLGYQGLMSLGMIENPLTNTKAVALDNARMLLDDLIMLQDKTSGNLDPDEGEHIEKLIRDLEHAFRLAEEQAAESEPAESD